MKKFIAILLVLNSFVYRAQQVFYSDVLNGGVTGNGGNSYGDTINLNVQIPPGSTIKKAFLLAARDGKPKNITVNLNGINYDFNNTNIVTTGFISSIDIITTESSIYAIDITTDINSSVNNYYLAIPNQGITAVNGFYNFFYLYIVFQNLSFPAMCTHLFLNTQNVSPITNYHLSYLNPMNSNFPVGLEAMTTSFCDILTDGSYVEVNTDTIGLIGGNDMNYYWGCAGPFPNFAYYNDNLFGLNDDTPDSLMGGADATADIKSYITNYDTTVALTFTYQTLASSGDYTNSIRGVILNYTTPCDTFSVNLLTADTTICKGTSVQLGAVSVNPTAKYEWFPTSGLSCSTCANPIASPDSTTYYTVRVWNTDSCSKVLPVRVKVLPLPKFTSIALTPTTCGVSTGSTASVSMSSTDSLFIDSLFSGIEPQNTTHLGAGNYTLYLIDTNSCRSVDTTITIGATNLTTALFTLNPTTGAVPLAVSSDNQSTHATDYNWYFQNDSSNVVSPSFEFDTAGTYTITLVAYNNTPNCSDTFSLQVVVYDSLQIIVPNVFTPNGDNQNDVFSIQVNAPCTGTITLTNRWGNVILTKDIDVDGNEKLEIWNGGSTGSVSTSSTTADGKASDGVYFYILSLRDKKGKDYRFQGFVELVK